MIKLLKQVGFIPLIMIALVAVGFTINSLIGSNIIYLTYFFALLRDVIMLFDFMIDTTTLMTLVGLSFSLIVGYQVYKITLFVLKYFK